MKAELHAHINGSLRDASILELAKWDEGLSSVRVVS